MTDVTFVRGEMLPPQTAPGATRGPVGWARANLFSSWLNAILTLLAGGAVLWLVAHAWPWFAHSVWNAGSLAECRETIKATWGPDASGACFAVIRQRWHQFLFGFYPPALYWRPTLAFALLFVALAPILFPRVPRGLLWFSIAYPGVAYWLLWGGPISVPLAVYAGFGVGALAMRLVAPLSSRLLAVIVAVLVTIVWWLYLAGPVARALPVLPLTPVASKQFGGFMLSITIGVTGIAFSLPLGILLALGRRSHMFFVKTICVGFIEFIRGVPLITLLLVATFLLNVFLPPGTNFDIILRVIIMVTLFAAAYMAEIVRGGLAALPRGQYEAADALGLDYWQAMRLIVMPQALKVSIPNIVSNFISLFKDTTLVAIIGLLDPIGLTTSIRADSSWNGIVWELYGFVALVFFVCCYGMSLYSKHLERRLRTDHR
ncbi:amino acid ABC transporter permease [Amaricoccus sp.]|uniref:amino acid ABC transporter permease n=1 Tax=Amaricoccus sp. TaxID=1872485 RepID=UPI001B5AD14F|nr:amino acid ABC transporter permease [Amaricoccus sp.]MBP7000214.1 amino acid ABC transporter permease [Amaricoccus sp.]